jgi:kinesin family protein C2/C3
LKTRALQENRELEHRIKEVELKLENSTKRGRYLEDLMESRIQTWDQKEIMLNQFVGLQVQNIQVLIGYKCYLFSIFLVRVDEVINLS